MRLRANERVAQGRRQNLLVGASLLSVGLLLSCADEVKPPAAPAVVVTQQALGVTGGDVPIPINSTTKEDAWDGTYAELLAADAWAECEASEVVGGFEATTLEPDQFVDYLLSKMYNASCLSTAPFTCNATTIGGVEACIWLGQRSDPNCNRDASSNVPAKRDYATTFTQIHADASPYYVAKAPSDCTNYSNPATCTDATLSNPVKQASSLGLTGPQAPMAVARAQEHVRRARTSLCMSQKLREHLDDAQVAFASGAELKQLLEFARERALTAVFEYSIVFQGLRDSTTTSMIDHPAKILSVYNAWKAALLAEASGGDASRLERLGSDFALAVDTLVEVSEQHQELLLRDAASQRDFGSYVDGWLEGGRAEALEHAYGLYADQSPKVVIEDMSAPQIEVLLSIARRATAVALTAKSNSFDIPANADALLRAAEVVLRKDECQLTWQFDASCWSIGASEVPEDFRLYKRHGIQPQHAETLVRALLELIFGLPASQLQGGDLWGYPDPLTIPADMAARVSGQHYYGGDFSAPAGGTLTLDPYFALVDDMAEGLQGHAWAYLPPTTLVANAHANDQGFGFSTEWIALDADTPLARSHPRRPQGTVPTLAYAREVISTLGANLSDLHGAAAASVPLIDAAIGQRQVAVRHSLQVVPASGASACDNWDYQDGFECPFTCGGDLSFVQPTSCNQLQVVTDVDGDEEHEVRAYVEPSDPFDQVSVTDPIAGEDEGVSATPTTLTTQTPPLANGAYEFRVGTYTPTAGQNYELALLQDAQHYLRVYRGRPDTPTSYPRGGVASIGDPLQPFGNPLLFGRIVTEGGRLNDQLHEAWLMQVDDWSQPRYDPFGLLTDWAPMGDASLYGGTSGEEAYQYFLRSAGRSARDATSALNTAFDTLFAESGDQVALAAAEERGATLRKLELTALCGEDLAQSGTSCEPSTTLSQLTKPDCGGDFLCSLMTSQIGDMLGMRDLRFCFGPCPPGDDGFPLASPVAAELDNNPPDFSRYQGGVMEGLLLQQWSAWRDLQGAVDTTVSSLLTSLSGLAALRAETAAADQDLLAVQADVNTTNNALMMAGQDLSFEVGQINARFDDIKSQLDLARSTWRSECEGKDYLQGVVSWCNDSCPNANNGICEDGQIRDHCPATGDPLQQLACSGLTYSSIFQPPPCSLGTDCSDCGVMNVSPHPCQSAGYNYKSADDREKQGWSAGPCFAVRQQCDDLRRQIDELTATLISTEPTDMNGLNASAYLEYLETRAAELLDPNSVPYQAVKARAVTAEARVAAAGKDERAGEAAVWDAYFSQLTNVQAAYDELVKSSAAIDRAVLQAELAAEKVTLEESLAQIDIKSRFGLRRRYHSYDMWRARALLENARRLAVTARRAIEARFVVDLSELQEPEAFVEPPAVWADEIYASDLKPPSSVGRTQGPNTTDDQAIYTNKLIDYVNNLELFVNGYAIGRPTATAYSDVEVIQLPAPSAVVEAPGPDGVRFAKLSSDAAQWSFFCEKKNAWLPNPNATDFAGTDWSLHDLCGDDQPPSQARLSFWLDPWGRLYGNPNDQPYQSRHNVRWGRLAVNLVGTGIRDCERNADPSVCYAEPFLSYDLRHVGPAWITSHDQAWQTLDLPVAVIESGKALASEQFLDPVANGLDLPEVQNVSRLEMAGRPLGGAYELTLHLGRDVRVENIERLQVLAATDYWVRQGTGGDGGPQAVAACASALCGDPNDGCCPPGCDDSTDSDCACQATVSCASAGAQCGQLDDGCGRMLECGNCPAPQVCGGGAMPNVCACIPAAEICDGLDNDCNGQIDDGAACLSGLVLSAGNLSPGFSPETTSYTLNVGVGVGSLQLTPTGAGAGASIIVDGTPVASGSASQPIALPAGASSISVVVTEGVQNQVYTVQIDRGLRADFLKPETTADALLFGYAVDRDGDVMAVGAEAVDADEGQDGRPGRVNVFHRTAAGWEEEALLRPNSPGDKDAYGFIVAVSGDTLVVGAPLEDSAATTIDGNESDDSAPDAGAAYVYRRDIAGNWTQEAYLKASNAQAGDGFGLAVAIDGNTIVVTATGESSGASTINGNQNDNSVSDAGAAYVFERVGTTWSQTAYIKGTTPTASGLFGFAVDLRGDLLAIAATDDASAGSTGAAYLYRRSGGAWALEQRIAAPSIDDDDFGFALKLSSAGDALAVGAPWEASAAVGVDGDETDNNSLGAGAVYVYRDVGASWVKEAYLKAFNTEPSDTYGYGDFFGFAVDFVDDTIVVGAPLESGSALGLDPPDNDGALATGAVYVFGQGAGGWSQVAYLKPAVTSDSGDLFGFALCLDQGELAVGAIGDDSVSTGYNADRFDDTLVEAGAVHLYSAGDSCSAAACGSFDACCPGSCHSSQDAQCDCIPSDEVCDGLDNDCNGVVDDACLQDLNFASGTFTPVFAPGREVYNVSVDLGYAFAPVTATSSTADAISIGGVSAVSAQATSIALPAGYSDVNVTLTQGGFTRDYELGVVRGWQNVYIKRRSVSAAGDRYGTAIAVDASQMLVGSPTAVNPGIAVAAGEVNYLQDSSSWWSQTVTYAPTYGDVGDDFGFAVALSGDTRVVGAPGDDSGVPGNPQDNSLGDSGAVYVYRTSTQEAYLKAPAPAAGEAFGFDVAIDGDILAVGAPGGATGGSVYVFERSGTVWSHVATLSDVNGNTGDEFGNSVALSGTTLAVGAHLLASGGAVHLFDRDAGGTWQPTTVVTSSNLDAGDLFGEDVALLGGLLVVGAPGEDSADTGVNRPGTSSGAAQSGAAYVFARDTGGNWAQTAYIKASNTQAADRFGTSVAISGIGVAIGAPREDSDSLILDGDQSDNTAPDAGAVYLFGQNGSGAWVQTTYVKAPNGEADDRFGASVGLAGAQIVVGMPGDDSIATGVGGDPATSGLVDSGAVWALR